jgi:hypothetical protein
MQKDANTILLFTDHRAAIDYLSDEDASKLIVTTSSRSVSVS